MPLAAAGFALVAHCASAWGSSGEREPQAKEGEVHTLGYTGGRGSGKCPIGYRYHPGTGFLRENDLPCPGDSISPSYCMVRGWENAVRVCNLTEACRGVSFSHDSRASASTFQLGSVPSDDPGWLACIKVGPAVDDDAGDLSGFGIDKASCPKGYTFKTDRSYMYLGQSGGDIAAVSSWGCDTVANGGCDMTGFEDAVHLCNRVSACHGIAQAASGKFRLGTTSKGTLNWNACEKIDPQPAVAESNREWKIEMIKRRNANLDNHEVPFTPTKWKTVEYPCNGDVAIVTGANVDYLPRLKGVFLNALTKSTLNVPVYIFAFKAKQQSSDEQIKWDAFASAYDFVTIIPFDYSKYPAFVGNTQAYAFKAPAIKEVSKKHQCTFWFDTSQEVARLGFMLPDLEKHGYFFAGEPDVPFPANKMVSHCFHLGCSQRDNENNRFPLFSLGR
jgi:hypothetical protein